MSWFFKSWRPAEKKDQARELRIATSESYSIRTSVEPLSVDGAGSYTSASKLRAALFVPEQSMTIKFHPESTKKSAARGQCVHSIEMFTRSETATILEDARRVGASIGWSDRGVSLPTQDVLVQHLSKESQDAVHRAIREKLLPFARRHYPHLNGALDKQPYPRPGNLFIVRYCASSARPGGRGLKLHTFCRLLFHLFLMLHLLACDLLDFVKLGSRALYDFEGLKFPIFVSIAPV